MKVAYCSSIFLKLTTILSLFLCCAISFGQETLIKRINCGGVQVTGADGLIYEADTSNGDVSFTSNSGTLNLSYVSPLVEPYRTFRYMPRATASQFNYTFNNLQSGQYKVILHFAEPFHGVQNDNWNTRRFGININNGEFSDGDFNIMTQAALPSTNPLDGRRKVYKLESSGLDVAGNSLVINFTQVANDPIVNAIEVYKIDNAPKKQGTPGGSSITSSSITLSWSRDDTVPIQNYKVYAKKEGTTEYLFNNTSVGSFPNVPAINLDSDTEYRFKVAAVGLGNPGLEGPLSDASTIYRTLTDGSPPNPGSGLWTQSTVNTDNIFFDTGNVGIGTEDPGSWKLAVNGNIRAKEIKVETDWADYVFEANYNLPTLEEVEKHIKEKGHLINIPSAAEVEANGIELGEMNKLLLEKIEELTLYILELRDELDQKSKTIEKNNVKLVKLESRLDTIEKNLE